MILNKCLKVKSRYGFGLKTYTRALDGYQAISIVNKVDNILEGLWLSRNVLELKIFNEWKWNLDTRIAIQLKL